MKGTHLFEGHIYVISNAAVAKNPIFKNIAYCKRFLQKINYYLSELCEILHYNIDDNQYQLIIRIFEREKICDYYRKKFDQKDLKENEIPFTTHIISQAMANLQSSTAIHFNRKEKRFGALFARRFHRVLVKSSEALSRWESHFNNMSKMYRQKKNWAYKSVKRKKWIKALTSLKERNAIYYLIRRIEEHPILSSYKPKNKIELQGQFKILPPRNIFELYSKLELVFYLKKQVIST